MRRADRLFLLVQALRRRRRAVTGRQLADELGVSLRTLYRDIAALQGSGVPVEGEPGVGYRLRPGADLPPLMFSADEAEALVLGLRLVTMAGPPRQAAAARDALARIVAVAPAALIEDALQSPSWAPGNCDLHGVKPRLALADRALRERRLVRIEYGAADGRVTQRTVEPVLLAFWGHGWTLAAWCRLRGGFRDFRVDRMLRIDIVDEPCSNDPDRGLPAYRAQLPADARA